MIVPCIDAICIIFKRAYQFSHDLFTVHCLRSDRIIYFIFSINTKYQAISSYRLYIKHIKG